MTRKYTHMTNNLQCTVIAFTVLSEKKKKNNSSLNQIRRIRSPVLGSVLGGFKFGYATFWLCNSRQIT